ncbi:MAG: hypothetical protein IPL39_21820 [Opitutaceae bacterium]|nr:hypothetical protein [Opitutaceae bacterium]
MRPSPCSLATLLGCALALGADAAPKITLEPWMVLSETAQTNRYYAGSGPVAGLVDEQQAVGDPLAGSTVVPTRFWFPGWNSGYTRYPASAIIDLRAEYDLTDLCLYDGDGSGTLTVAAGTPFAWEHVVFTDSMNAWPQGWKSTAVQVRTRYLRVTAANDGAIPKEIVVYGTLVAGQTPEPQPPALPRRRTTMDELIGTNSFIDDPVGLIEQVGHLREYHVWQWDEGNGGAYPGFPANQNAWSPSWVGWDFDAFYRNLHRLGVEVTPVISQAPPWLRGAASSSEIKPIPLDVAGQPTRDPLAPASYAEHADHLFQYAARFGAEPVPANLLKLRADQAPLSGQGTLRYYENWNEQDKWWEGPQSYFTPFEFAAMTSADWDGHLGTMGDTIGIAHADPSGRLVMGGLALPDVDYLRAMAFWFKHRRGDVPLAALNVHHYCNDTGGQEGQATTGISPEADGLRERFTALVDFRNRHLRESELWMTEFGWDVDQRSIQRAPGIAGMSAEETQARWIVRTWLEFAAAGVDRGHQYMMRDVVSPGAGGSDIRFATSGLVGPKGDWSPRPSFYYQATLRQRLRGLHYQDDLALPDPDLRAYRFADSADRVRAIVVWSGTASGKSVASVALPLPAGTTRATRVTLTNGNLAGVAAELTLAGATVAVAVDEKPTIVLLEGRNARTRLPDRILKVGAAQVTRESGGTDGDPAMLVDEQGGVGNPDFGKGLTLGSAWSPGWSLENYPAVAQIDLGRVRRVTKIYLNDHHGDGPFTTETGGPGAWRFLARDALLGSGSWIGHVTDGPTRYVRCTAEARGANVAEIAIYARDFTGYGDWAERAFPGTEDFFDGDAAPGADADGDGVDNLLEYALGGDPRVPETGLLPVVAADGTKLALTYVRDLWLKDVAWAVEWSTDLVNWSSADVTEVIELETPDFERRRAEVAVEGRTRLFLRLKVALTAAP